jgi:nucleotide-binding universal stress UspA family protein
MFHRLLIATDLCEGLQRLVNFVPDLAASGLEQIVFCHCVPLLEDRGVPRVDINKVAQAQERLQVALQTVPEGIDIQVDIQSGRASHLILEAIERHHSDLVLVGMSTHSLLNEKLFGSTTNHLAQQISVPLLILRPQQVSVYTEEEMALRCRHLFRYLLIPYDHSPSAQYVVQFIQDRAADRPPQSLESVMLCWVLEKPGRRDLHSRQQWESSQGILEQVQGAFETLGLQANAEVCQGEAISELQRVALEYDISALAVSSRHFGKVLELSIPSLAGEIIRRSWHPVIFVPPSRG